jgi:protein SCO1
MRLRRQWSYGVLLLVGGALGLFARSEQLTRNAQASPAEARAAARGGRAEPSLFRLGSSFVTDDGKAITLADLRGDVQVLALIFTRCPSLCPTLVADLRRLEQRLPQRVAATTRFTLVSIDPEHDTPEVLHAYRERMKLGPRWTLLRGDLDSVRELAAVLGFSFGSDGRTPAVHSKLVTLLGPEGQVLHQQAGVADDPERILTLIARAP